MPVVRGLFNRDHVRTSAGDIDYPGDFTLSVPTTFHADCPRVRSCNCFSTGPLCQMLNSIMLRTCISQSRSIRRDSKWSRILLIVDTGDSGLSFSHNFLHSALFGAPTLVSRLDSNLRRLEHRVRSPNRRYRCLYNESNS